MTYFLLVSSSFFNFCFFIFAIGFFIALTLEQVVKKQGNELDIYIVTTNRKFCWQQAWVVNVFWFLCIILLSISPRSSMPMGSDMIWDGL